MRTTSFVCLLMAFQTLPYVPSPSCFTTLYLHNQVCNVYRQHRSQRGLVAYSKKLRALPVLGTWDKAGAHNSDAEKVTATPESVV